MTKAENSRVACKPSADRIAADLCNLSVGQKRALLGIPLNRDFRPEYTGFQWPTLACLKRARLINSVADGLSGCGPKAQHRITDRGRRVRALLEKEA